MRDIRTPLSNDTRLDRNNWNQINHEVRRWQNLSFEPTQFQVQDSNTGMYVSLLDNSYYSDSTSLYTNFDLQQSTVSANTFNLYGGSIKLNWQPEGIAQKKILGLWVDDGSICYDRSKHKTLTISSPMTGDYYVGILPYDGTSSDATVDRLFSGIYHSSSYANVTAAFFDSTHMPFVNTRAKIVCTYTPSTSAYSYSIIDYWRGDQRHSEVTPLPPMGVHVEMQDASIQVAGTRVQYVSHMGDLYFAVPTQQIVMDDAAGSIVYVYLEATITSDPDARTFEVTDGLYAKYTSPQSVGFVGTIYRTLVAQIKLDDTFGKVEKVEQKNSGWVVLPIWDSTACFNHTLISDINRFQIRNFQAPSSTQIADDDMVLFKDISEETLEYTSASALATYITNNINISGSIYNLSGVICDIVSNCGSSSTQHYLLEDIYAGVAGDDHKSPNYSYLANDGDWERNYVSVGFGDAGGVPAVEVPLRRLRAEKNLYYNTYPCDLTAKNVVMADWDTQVLYTNNQWFADGSTSIPIDAGDANTIKSVDWSNQELHTPVYNTGKSLCWRDCTMYGFAPSGLTLDWANCELVVAGVPTIGWDACQLTDRAGDLSHDWEQRKLYDDSSITSIDYRNRQLDGVWSVLGDGTSLALSVSGGITFTAKTSGESGNLAITLLDGDAPITIKSDYYGFPLTNKIGQTNSDYFIDTQLGLRGGYIYVGDPSGPPAITFINDGSTVHNGYDGTFDTYPSKSVKVVAGFIVSVT